MPLEHRPRQVGEMIDIDRAKEDRTRLARELQPHMEFLEDFQTLRAKLDEQDALKPDDPKRIDDSEYDELAEVVQQSEQKINRLGLRAKLTMFERLEHVIARHAKEHKAAAEIEERSNALEEARDEYLAALGSDDPNVRAVAAANFQRATRGGSSLDADLTPSERRNLREHMAKLRREKRASMSTGLEHEADASAPAPTAGNETEAKRNAGLYEL